MTLLTMVFYRSRFFTYVTPGRQSGRARTLPESAMADFPAPQDNESRAARPPPCKQGNRIINSGTKVYPDHARSRIASSTRTESSHLRPPRTLFDVGSTGKSGLGYAQKCFAAASNACLCVPPGHARKVKTLENQRDVIRREPGSEPIHAQPARIPRPSFQACIARRSCFQAMPQRFLASRQSDPAIHPDIRCALI